MWASVSSCLTPTVLFCILNLTIVTIVITSTRKKHYKLSDDQDNSPPQLTRVPSLLERVKSINLSKYRSEQADPFDSAAPPQEPTHQQNSECVEESHVTRSRSDTCRQAPTKRVLKKSASEKMYLAEPEEEADLRRPATVKETTSSNWVEDEAVDAKADDFINRFRQQLKLQRLDSILRYKEMLSRGVRN
ncbi:Hypothetical predicted protein [Olea europaea subsp. europaea]|uniref:DUF4408 domain-containing protein n=1 Tax=Olea europaea subsp. europaea TaxID=158383 RepID=A0A8S0TV84_OLEEU|nr:Hypothetical predicted protein [Olea europaea subsp. europaea]